MSLTKAFRAGFVRRWHMNPDLCHTVDRIDGHSARVARIILMIHPDPSMSLISAALIHDDGESGAGDVCGLVKRDLPALSKILDDLEQIVTMDIWGYAFSHEGKDLEWLKFADRLDAYMWAKHHAPHVMDSDGWPEARQRLIDAAICFEVLGQVADILESEVTI